VVIIQGHPDKELKKEEENKLAQQGSKTQQKPGVKKRSRPEN
jgi:hypothetical protein